MPPALPLLLALASASPEEGYRFPPQTAEGVRASLVVRVGGRGPAPGLGRVTYTVEVAGPAGAEVEPPRLEDATASWKAAGRWSGWSVEGGRLAWAEAVALEQVKPGPQPLPGVRLRARAAADGPWHTFAWADVLKEPRPAPTPEAPPPPPPSPWPRRLAVAALALAGAGVAFAAVGLWRRRGARPRPLPAHARALARIDAAPPPPATDARAYHDLLADAVRAYLGERFGLPAARQTTEQFFASLRQETPLSAEQASLLTEFFTRCDVARFAPTSPDAEQCRAAAELARAVVRQQEGEAGRDKASRQHGAEGQTG